MRATPPIPSWIKEFEHPGYTNIFKLLPECPRLYATETLFGDWDARTLLLAKDPAPTSVLERLIPHEGNDAWRHAQRSRGDQGGYKTNEQIERQAGQIPGTKLYGSATAHMMFNDPAWSRSLPGFTRGPLHDHLIRVLRWVISSMPNLTAIGCLGNEAWYLTASAFEAPGAARLCAQYRNESRVLQGVVEGKKLLAVPLYHPASRVSAPQKANGWKQLCAD